MAIATFTKDYKMILTRQYRHPFGRITYDIPAGRGKNGETPYESAPRELQEDARA